VKSKKRRTKDQKKSHEKDIKLRRQRLLAQIEEFHQDGQQFLQDTADPEDDKTPSNSEDNEEDWDWADDGLEGLDVDGSDIESDEMSDDGYDDVEGAVQPENIPLDLPSALGQDACARRGIKAFMEQEIKLRTGQANDALAQIRSGLQYKSFLWREKFRHAENADTRTRSMTQITSVDQLVQQHVKAYTLAFKALTNLGSANGFQPIQKGDLIMNANILKENHYNMSNETLPWIWRTGERSDDEKNDAWMQERKQCPFIQCSCSHNAHTS
jgi:hypothetical protein